MYIFISYKSEYRDFAYRVRDTLKDWGYETWLDADNIPAGQYFRFAIQDGLDNSDVIIGIVTPEAISSKEVLFEWDHAINGHSRLLLLIYKPSKLPYHLKSIQYIDFTQNKGLAFNQLQTALTNPDQSYYRKQKAKRREINQLQKNNRLILLNHVYEFWIDGVLHNALGEKSTSLSINIAPTSRAVLEHRDYGDYKFPETALDIKMVFEDMHGELLILGAPGCGKTILLLQLAKKLINKAWQDKQCPIPIVFNLSSWAATAQPLEAWLVNELLSKYHVPQKAAKEWIEHEEVLLLLDGLDEVNKEERANCVEAINTFRMNYSSIKLTICSRSEEYEELTTKLNLRAAITLQPLSEEQITAYLAMPSYQVLRDRMRADKTLQDIAHIPFLLNTMAYAYKGAKPQDLALNLAKDDKSNPLKHLFEQYVEKRIKSDKSKSLYSAREIRHYLKMLAAMMVKHGVTTFYIEELQPNWLGNSTQRRLFRLLYGLIIGFVFGLSVWFSEALHFNSIDTWLFGISYGLAYGLCLTLDAIDSGFGTQWYIRLIRYLLIIGVCFYVAGILQDDMNFYLTISFLLAFRRISLIQDIRWSFTKSCTIWCSRHASHDYKCRTHS